MNKLNKIMKKATVEKENKPAKKEIKILKNVQ